MYEDLGPPPTDGERDRTEGNDPPQTDTRDPGLFTSRPTNGGTPPTMEAPSKKKARSGSNQKEPSKASGSGLPRDSNGEPIGEQMKRPAPKTSMTPDTIRASQAPGKKAKGTEVPAQSDFGHL